MAATECIHGLTIYGNKGCAVCVEVGGLVQRRPNPLRLVAEAEMPDEKDYAPNGHGDGVLVHVRTPSREAA